MQDQRAKMTQQANIGLRGTKNKEVDADKKFEAECIALQAAREAHEILQEKELKEAQKREAKQYASHLQALMGKINSDDSFRNAQFKAEEDAEWAKREAGWKREEDQRQRLWQRVHEERQNQLREKGTFFKIHIHLLTPVHSVGRSLVPHERSFSYNELLASSTIASRESGSDDNEWLRVLQSFIQI